MELDRKGIDLGSVWFIGEVGIVFGFGFVIGVNISVRLRPTRFQVQSTFVILSCIFLASVHDNNRCSNRQTHTMNIKI